MEQRFLLFRLQRRPPPQRQQPSLEQDLVRVRVADPREKLLVPQQVLELIAKPAQPLAKRIQAHRSDRIRLRPLRVPRRHLPGAIADPVDPPHVPKVEVTELLLALDPEREDLGGGHRDVRAADLEPSAEHRVDDKPPGRPAAAQLGREDEVLAAPRERRDPPRRQLQGEVVDRVTQQVRLLRIDRRPGDQLALHARADADPQSLQLGQLGHACKTTVKPVWPPPTRGKTKGDETGTIHREGPRGASGRR